MELHTKRIAHRVQNERKKTKQNVKRERKKDCSRRCSFTQFQTGINHWRAEYHKYIMFRQFKNKINNPYPFFLYPPLRPATETSAYGYISRDFIPVQSPTINPRFSLSRWFTSRLYKQNCFKLTLSYRSWLQFLWS